MEILPSAVVGRLHPREALPQRVGQELLGKVLQRHHALHNVRTDLKILDLNIILVNRNYESRASDLKVVPNLSFRELRPRVVKEGGDLGGVVGQEAVVE